MNDARPRRGDPPNETLDQFYQRTQMQYIRMAMYWVRRLRIDENGLSAEGAVQNAWMRLLDRLQQPHGAPGLRNYPRTAQTAWNLLELRLEGT
jgi:hypothetical protein